MHSRQALEGILFGCGVRRHPAERVHQDRLQFQAGHCGHQWISGDRELTLALSCDPRIAVESANLSQPEINLVLIHNQAEPSGVPD